MNDNDDDVARVMARNEEILECQRQIQFWIDRLAQLEAPRRREALLASFDLNPCGTWLGLTEEEKQEKDWVIKAISNGVFRNDTWFRYSFGGHEYRGEDLPEQFREDRDVVLAFIARDDFEHDFYHRVFEVPESLRDDKEVMLAVCEKNSKALQLASPRLQDDRDVVLAALGGDKHLNQSQLEHASNRLRSDKDFILNQVKCTSVENCNGFHWLKCAQLGLEDEKQVALAALKRVSELKSSGYKSSSMGIIPHLSADLRDDRDVMLQFVEDHWHNLGICSKRLQSSEEFVNTAVTQNANALIYCTEAAKDDFFSKRDKNDVLKDLEVGDIWFESLPKEMKTDPRVLLAALKGDSIVSFEALPDDLRQKKEFILSVIPEEPEEGFYHDIPDHLQEDEEVCLELLKKRYCRWEAIFEKVPSLYRSTEAVQAVIDTACIGEGMYDVLPDFLQGCPFRDDEEVMLVACETEIECLKYASGRLKSNRGFIQTLLSRSQESAYILLCVSHDFQVNNADIVLEAIELSGVDDCYRWSPDDLAPGLWQDRSIVMACSKKGWPILKNLDSESPLLDDAELVRLAVENYGVSELQYASLSLKTDRDFALSVVKINGLSLRYVAATFKRDDEIVTEAIANTGNTILHCFRSERDFGYLVSLAARVRSRLELHKSFLNDFLRGISVYRPHVAPAKRCRLPILDRGSETSTAFKKLIAEYLGVPIKAELRLLRTASENLRKLRY